MFKHVSRAVVLVCASLLVAACGSSSSKTASTSASSASTGASSPTPANSSLKGSVTMGAILPLTGGSAASGKDMERGVELAIERINSEKGVLGKQLAVKTEDSQGTTAPAVEAARKLVAVDHVPAVVGEYLSANTIAVGKYLQSVGVVDLNPAATSPELTKIGNYFFSTIGLDTLSAKFAAEKLYQAGYRNISYLGPNTPAGSGIANSLKSVFEGMGGKIKTSILYQEGKSEYRSELKRLQQSNAELFVYLSYVPDSQTINKDAFELGIKGSQWYGTYLSLELQGLSPQLAAGQQGQELSYVGSGGAGFQSAYKAKYGEGVQTPFSSLTYDAVMMGAKAIDSAGSTEPSKVRQALATLAHNYPGATGPITFDSQGQREEQQYSLLKANSAGKAVPEQSVQGPKG